MRICTDVTLIATAVLSYHSDAWCVLVCSGVAAKVYAQTMQQNYPLQAKKHKLTSIKIFKWAAVICAVEGGIQFAGLIFSRVEAHRALCVTPHNDFSLLIMFGPALWKVSSCNHSKQPFSSRFCCAACMCPCFSCIQCTVFQCILR